MAGNRSVAIRRNSWGRRSPEVNPSDARSLLRRSRSPPGAAAYHVHKPVHQVVQYRTVRFSHAISGRFSTVKPIGMALTWVVFSSARYDRARNTARPGDPTRGDRGCDQPFRDSAPACAASGPDRRKIADLTSARALAALKTSPQYARKWLSDGNALTGRIVILIASPSGKWDNQNE